MVRLALRAAPLLPTFHHFQRRHEQKMTDPLFVMATGARRRLDVRRGRLQGGGPAAGARAGRWAL